MLEYAAVGVDDQGVVRGQAGQRQAALLGAAADVELAPLSVAERTRLGDQVDERVGARARRR